MASLAPSTNEKAGGIVRLRCGAPSFSLECGAFSVWSVPQALPQQNFLNRLKVQEEGLPQQICKISCVFKGKEVPGAAECMNVKEGGV